MCRSVPDQLIGLLWNNKFWIMWKDVILLFLISLLLSGITLNDVLYSIILKAPVIKCRVLLFTTAQQPPVGQVFLTVKVLRSHSDKLQSVGFLWTSDQPDAEISTWQHTTLTREKSSILGRIRTHNASKRVAADPCLRRRGHRDQKRRALAHEIKSGITYVEYLTVTVCDRHSTRL